MATIMLEVVNDKTENNSNFNNGRKAFINHVKLVYSLLKNKLNFFIIFSIIAIIILFVNSNILKGGKQNKKKYKLLQKYSHKTNI
jgi:hypothetical protein